MKKTKTIDERISILEKLTGYCKGKVPGTSLTRIITETDIEWTLSLGLSQERKRFFTSKTIEGCIKSVEHELIH